MFFISHADHRSDKDLYPAGVQAGTKAHAEHPEWTEQEVSQHAAAASIGFLMTNPNGVERHAKGYVKGYNQAKAKAAKNAANGKACYKCVDCKGSYEHYEVFFVSENSIRNRRPAQEGEQPKENEIVYCADCLADCLHPLDRGMDSIL